MAGWGGYAGSGAGSGGSKDWVREGNADVFVFTAQPTRCRFLTEDVSAEDVMQERKVPREAAEELIATSIAKERWTMPRSVWEHTIKEIPGKRFFSTTACRGRGRCFMCDENDEAKANGVEENKLLPYPVRRRFYVPAYFYDLGRVLFVKAAEKFFDDVAAYIGRNGSGSDFDIYKSGKGLNTEYKSVYVGPAKAPEGGYPAVPLRPCDLNVEEDEAEVRRKVAGGRREDAPAQGNQHPAPAPAPAQQAPVQASAPAKQAPVQAEAEFTIPFGQHKGKTFAQLLKDGNGDYVKFLAENSAGAVQKKAREFLGMA